MTQSSVEKTEAVPNGPRRLSAVLDATATPLEVVPASERGVVVARVALLAALFVGLHYEQILLQVRAWLEEPNWGHGFLIPVFSLYLLYARRQELAIAPRRTCWLGLVIMVALLVFELAAVLMVKNNWLWGLGMVGMLFGLVLFTAGPAVMRLAWLPILFLTLAVPLPDSVYTRIAYPLQELAAAGAVGILKIFGVDIHRSASNLSLVSRGLVQRDLTVAEACAGMRLLMAFFALGVATAYLQSRPVWQRVVLVAAGVPIAVLCNVFRVAITCTMHYVDRPEWGEGFLHSFTGMLMLIPAFGMLYGLAWLLRRLVIEEDEPGEDRTAQAGEGGGA